MKTIKTGTPVPSIDTTTTEIDQKSSHSKKEPATDLMQRFKQKLHANSSKEVIQQSALEEIRLREQAEAAIDEIFDDYHDRVRTVVHDGFQDCWDATIVKNRLEDLGDVNEALKTRIVEETSAAVEQANQEVVWAIETSYIDARDDVLGALTSPSDEGLDETAEDQQRPLSFGHWTKHVLDEETTLSVKAKIVSSDPELPTKNIALDQAYGNAFMEFDGTMLIEAHDFDDLASGIVAQISIVWDDQNPRAKHCLVHPEHMGRGIGSCLLALGWKLTKRPVVTDMHDDLIETM